jgi:hypothetical protein
MEMQSGCLGYRMLSRRHNKGGAISTSYDLPGTIERMTWAASFAPLTRGQNAAVLVRRAPSHDH